MAIRDEPTQPHAARLVAVVSRLFAPGRRLLAAFGLVQKFALVLVLLALPLAYISYGYVAGSAADRVFTQREIAGTDLLIESVDLLIVAVDHRSAPIGAAAIETARAHLLTQIERHGASLDLLADWELTSDAIDRAIGVGRADPTVRAAAVEAIRRFIVTIGDRSNLTLDPDLDSYYLMDAAQYRYPALVTIAGEYEYRMERSGDSARSSAERWASTTDLARVTSAELVALSSGQATVARETDDTFVRAAAVARSEDADARARVIDQALAGATGTGWVELDVEAPTGPGASTGADDRSQEEAPAANGSAALAAMPSTDHVRADWDEAIVHLRHVLHTRLDSMTDQYRWFLAGATACVALATYLLLSLFSGLLRSLRDIRRVLRHTGEGDLSATVDAVGSDELAEVSRAINATVARVAAAQAELERRATHDGLTGLPNRQHFVELLEERMRQARPAEPVAIGFVDLDGFKSVNDLHGHHSGDRVLRVVAERLQEASPPGSVCARLAGDEYAVLAAPGMSCDAVRDAMQRLLHSLVRPIELVDGRGHVVLEGASLGLAFHDGSTPLDAEGLLAAADSAMYDAKSTAPGLVREFTTELAGAVRRRTRVRSELARALADPGRSGFSVAYQPIVDLRTSEIVGAEALARWATPELGSVPPSEFVPLAESTGLISALGTFVLAAAAGQLARCQRARSDLFMSVNVSAIALTDGELESHVTQAAQRAGVAPETFWLELTESAMMIDPPGAARKLASLRRLGHPVAIDDFGTGYSSLSYLHSLELSALKIDRSFTGAIDDPAASAKVHILEMMLELSRRLGLDVVAEGIETPDQLAALAGYGVSRGQGYLLHRPMSGPSFDHLLTDRAPIATSVSAR